MARPYTYLKGQRPATAPRPATGPRLLSPHTATAPAAPAAAPTRPDIRTFARMNDLSALPDQRAVTIEINGCPSGVVTCAPDAPKELAVGWAFAWGYLDAAAELGRVTLRGDRVALMVDGGRDLSRLQRRAAGWDEPEETAHRHDEPGDGDEPFRITEGRLRLIAERAYERFREDRGDDGFLHAALADFEVVRCIARDLDARAAIDKVIGWSLLQGVAFDGAFLLVRGTITRQIVQRARRARLALIVGDELATREAVQAAHAANLTVVGRALGPDRLLLHDGGHLQPDREPAATTA